MKQEMNERDVSPCHERASKEKILNSFHLSYSFIITLALRFRHCLSLQYGGGISHMSLKRPSNGLSHRGLISSVVEHRSLKVKV